MNVQGIIQPDTTRKRETKFLSRLIGDDLEYIEKYERIRNISSKVTVSEYHLTNACNIRCEGCWFFEFGFDRETKEVTKIGPLDEFLQAENARGINAALVIGGEPTLFPKRLESYRKYMDYLTISTNGLKGLPVEGFEDVAVLISLFGGGKLDDEIRAIKPNGDRFTGLFQSTLKNYTNDPRACFIFAVTEDGLDYIEATVKAICENGNRVSFNFYSKYGSDDPLRQRYPKRLLDRLLEIKELYPTTVLSTRYYIQTMVTGKSHWGEFGYQQCPSVSVDHPANKDRVANGLPVLPKFNTWAADLATVNFCCTSGHCEDCRDSQAVFSWLLVNMARFRRDGDLMKAWIDISESYWKQFIWSGIT
ncbi:MAG TPA: hypothetical protein VNZ48_11290 [Xanthobacteraceae bacterium]|jgi:hypothetical protein|nr:hypothetical protein [Xanthobacteraceae bacterium]